MTIAGVDFGPSRFTVLGFSRCRPGNMARLKPPRPVKGAIAAEEKILLSRGRKRVAHYSDQLAFAIEEVNVSGPLPSQIFPLGSLFLTIIAFRRLIRATLPICQVDL